MINIGILGCDGFVGSHLLERLLAEDRYRVFGLDLQTSRIEQYLPNSHFHFSAMDIQDTAKLGPFLKRCDIVVSLAALCNPAQYNTIPLKVIDVNFVHPMRLVEMCAGMGKRLIYFSTSEVYGKTIQGMAGQGLKKPEFPPYYLLSEDTSPLIMGPISAQRWSYAAAKQLIERVIYAHGASGSLEYAIIRPFNFIGPRMDYLPGIDGEGIPRVLACFMDALMFHKPLQLVDGGINRRTFTDISDAVSAVMRIIERPDAARNQIFNIGNPNNEISIAALAEKMVSIYKALKPEHAKRKFSILNVSSDAFYGKGYEDSDRRVPDISKAEQLLGWRPRIRLDEMLRPTMASYIQYYSEKRKAG